MNSQTSRKIIVAGGMAIVVVAGIFALRAHHDTVITQTPVTPPTPFAEAPAAPTTPGTDAQTPGAPGTNAQTPTAPATDVTQTPAAPAARPPNEISEQSPPCCSSGLWRQEQRR